MTEREALKLALEALERGVKDGYWNKDTVDASTRIKEVLAQPEQEHVATSDTSEKRVDEMAKQRHEPEQEPQYAGTARELFTNAAIERLDVRPSTKVYLGTPSVCEQPAHQEPVWDASAPMVVHLHPAFQATPPQSEPVIDKSAAIRIATSLGWEPKRKPLTIVELQKHWQVAKVLDMTDAEISFPDYVLITKDVEALHGIKEKNT